MQRLTASPPSSSSSSVAAAASAGYSIEGFTPGHSSHSSVKCSNSYADSRRFSVLRVPRIFLIVIKLFFFVSDKRARYGTIRLFCGYVFVIRFPVFCCLIESHLMFNRIRLIMNEFICHYSYYGNSS